MKNYNMSDARFEVFIAVEIQDKFFWVVKRMKCCGEVPTI